MPNEASWKILHFKHKNLRLMNSAAHAIRYQFMELGNRSSARVQSNYWTWNDRNTNDSAGDPFERPASEAIFPRREERVGKLSLKIVGEVCTAITWHLGPVSIKLPFTENETKELVAQSEKAHVIPQCLEALDGSHIKIKQPAIIITHYRDLNKPKTAISTT